MPTIHTSDITFNYRERAVEAPTETLFFLHGSLASSRWWLPLMEHFPSTWRLVAVDWLNQNDEASYAVPALANHVGQIAEALSLQDFHLIAHAFGGAVAMESVLRGTLRPLSLVLVDTAPASGVDTPEEVFPYLERMQTDRALLVQALASVMPSVGPTDFFQSLVEDARIMPPAAFTAPASALATWNATDRLRELTLPTLLVWGEHDIIVDFEATRATFLGISGAANLEVLRGCGHSPMIEQPASLADSIVRFIEEFRTFGGPESTDNARV